MPGLEADETIDAVVRRASELRSLRVGSSFGVALTVSLVSLGPVPGDAAAQPSPAAAPSASPATTESTFPPLWYAGMTVATLAVGGYVVGGVFSSVYARQWDEAKSLCSGSAIPSGCFDQQDAALDDASSTAAGAAAGFALSGAVLGAAIALFVGGMPDAGSGEGSHSPASDAPTPTRRCTDDAQCAAEELCDEGECEPRTEARDMGLVAGGITCMSLGFATIVPTVVLMIASADFGGSSPGDPGLRIGAGVLSGVSIGLMVVGATMTGVGASEVQAPSARAPAATWELRPALGPGFAGMTGRF